MPPSPIQEIRIKGYKSLADEPRLEIRPLTILAGANSSGKSSVMQPLLLLKQTLASPSEPGAMEIAGPNVQFTNYEQMFYKCLGNGKSAKSLHVGFSMRGREGVDTIDIRYTLAGRSLEIKSQESVVQVGSEEFWLTKLRPGKLSALESGLLPPQVLDLGRKMNEGRDPLFFFRGQLSRGFLSLAFGPENDASVGPAPMNFESPTNFRRAILELIHIPGLRGNPERNYLLRKTKGPRFDGYFQDYVAGIIAGWKGDERLGRLGEDLRHLGLTWKIEARALDDTSVEILVGRLKKAQKAGARDLVNIADVGFGVSQILPALVALETANPGQLIHLEQPEIHLHPKAQRNLAKLFMNAAKSDKRLVVETHSSILIRGIQTLVAEGQLDPKLVKLHWFSRNEETGVTQVSSADLDENGAFGADWPEDFDDTYLESERDYLDAVEARMAR